jgi:cell wall assembly regulator SMI1
MRGIAQAELVDIAANLEARGTRLRPPADDQSLTRLEAAIGGPLTDEARALFSVFDGFEAEMADEETMVCLWSADAIRQKVEAEGAIAKGQVIGDYSLSADLFRCDLRTGAAKVWWDDRGTIAASSLFDFYRQVAEGTFEP